MEGLQELTIELCDRCPQKCLHCSSNSSPICVNELDEAAAVSLIRQAASIGTRKISLGGGEPVLSHHLDVVLTEAAALQLDLEIFTCGIASLPPELGSLPAPVIESWTHIPNLKVIFSLQGATASVHDHVTQAEGSYDVLMKSLCDCIFAGVTCELNFVPLRPNVREFPRFVELAEELGIHRASALRFVPQGRGLQNRDELELSREEEDAFVRQLVELRQSHRLEIRTGSPFNGIVPGNRVPCRAGFRKLVVQANGNVLPCEVFKDARRSNWNLNIYDQSLHEIMASKCLTSLRRELEASCCFECPIHRTLRRQQRTEGDHERVPAPAIYAP